MKKAEVKIGGKYYANVSGNRCEIQIDAENLAAAGTRPTSQTARRFSSRALKRLQGEVVRKRGRAKVTTEGNVTVENEPPRSKRSEAILPQRLRSSRSHARQKQQLLIPPTRREAFELRRCGLESSCESSEPMNAQELITAMKPRATGPAQVARRLTRPVQRDPSSRLGQGRR